MAFRVGQKVVCIKPCVREFPGCAHAIVGNTYTVRGMSVDHRGDVGLYFEEIHNPINLEHRAEYGHYAFRFRPVVEKSTDTGMAILREILDRESHNERVPLKA